MLKVTLNDTQVRQAIRTLRANAPKLIISSVNRAAASARTLASREISKDMSIKVGAARDAITIVAATPARPTATLYASAKRIPVIDFGARGPEPSRGRGRGVSAKTPAKRYPRAFIATMRSGHRGVFQRVGKTRLAIRELFGASIYHVFGKHSAAMAARAQEQLIKNLQGAFRYVTRR